MLRSPALEPIPLSRLAALREALQESNIPIIVQVHDWARLPSSFHQEIQRQYVIVWEKAG